MKLLIGALIWTGLLLAQAGGGDIQTYDIRNGDQTGKLILRSDQLGFESLTDAKHSRNWKYAEIREFTKKGSGFRVKPMKGSTYDFQMKDKKLRDRLYDTISQRIVAARQAGK